MSYFPLGRHYTPVHVRCSHLLYRFSFSLLHVHWIFYLFLLETGSETKELAQIPTVSKAEFRLESLLKQWKTNKISHEKV